MNEIPPFLFLKKVSLFIPFASCKLAIFQLYPIISDYIRKNPHDFGVDLLKNLFLNRFIILLITAYADIIFTTVNINFSAFTRN